MLELVQSAHNDGDFASHERMSTSISCSCLIIRFNKGTADSCYQMPGFLRFTLGYFKLLMELSIKYYELDYRTEYDTKTKDFSIRFY